MKNTDELNWLIDQAKAITGTDKATAQMLGMGRDHIAAWRSGNRTCTPEDQALLAAIVGLDPLQTLAQAMIEKWKGKPKGELLMHALGSFSV